MTKNEIIDAAFRVWGRDFYKKTSLTHLAKELKVSKPALYRHFLCKNDLADAMTERFCEEFAAYIKEDFRRAKEFKDTEEGLYIILRAMAGYMGRNVYHMIFNLTNLYERKIDGQAISERIKSHGVDMSIIGIIVKKKYDSYPVNIHLVMATLIFFMSNFHKSCGFAETKPTDEEIEKIINALFIYVKQGLGFCEEKVNSIDFDVLEKMVNEIKLNEQIEPLFKAVAEAVAEAGPWEASMEMVAKRMGLSKSSLYGHFKNRKDMLRRLFITEFKRIIDFARQGIDLSSDAASRLYLGIFSIAVYLRSRPEILIAMDWIRTRKLDFGKPDKDLELFRLFEDIEIEQIKNSDESEKQKISHWIMFLLINILMKAEIDNKKNNFCLQDCRLLYRFITLGLGGFTMKKKGVKK